MAEQVLGLVPVEPPAGTYEAQSIHGGKRLEAQFDNGYGASVVCHQYSYGGPQGLFELAVLHGNPVDRSDLCYSTLITDDVIGWLNQMQVIDLLYGISALQPNPDCDHSRPDLDDDYDDYDEEDEDEDDL